MALFALAYHEMCLGSGAAAWICGMEEVSGGGLFQMVLILSSSKFYLPAAIPMGADVEIRVYGVAANRAAFGCRGVKV